MIGSSKNNREIIRENAQEKEHKKKEPGLNPNRPSNNWALEARGTSTPVGVVA